MDLFCSSHSKSEDCVDNQAKIVTDVRPQSLADAQGLHSVGTLNMISVSNFAGIAKRASSHSDTGGRHSEMPGVCHRFLKV
jgi:hypothetical protein